MGDEEREANEAKTPLIFLQRPRATYSAGPPRSAYLQTTIAYLCAPAPCDGGGVRPAPAVSTLASRLAVPGPWRVVSRPWRVVASRVAAGRYLERAAGRWWSLGRPAVRPSGSQQRPPVVNTPVPRPAQTRGPAGGSGRMEAHLAAGWRLGDSSAGGRMATHPSYPAPCSGRLGDRTASFASSHNRRGSHDTVWSANTAARNPAWHAQVPTTEPVPQSAQSSQASVR